MSGKRNIKGFGKTYHYLQDPALRTKETGDALLSIEGAEFSGVNFQYLIWKNIRFVNCDFAGAYETKLERLEKSVFENCKFVGIHDFGDMVDVTLRRCAFGGEANVMGDPGSKRLVFEECNFVGTDSNRNHWGAVGGYGEAAFVRCKGKWFDFSGHTRLTIIDCQFESVSSKHDPREVGGVLAPMLIERSKLGGTFDMIVTRIESLTIRDTQIDILDMNNATVTGDILMERVRGNSIRAGVVSVRNLTLRNCQLNNDGNTAFMTAVQGSEQLLIDNCTISGGMLKGVSLGAGRPLEANEWSATPKNKNTTIRTSKLSYLDATWFETQYLRIDNTQIERADISHGRIGTLELNDATFGFTLDLSQTQVKEFKQSGGSDLRKLGGFKVEGSNVKLPR